MKYVKWIWAFEAIHDKCSIFIDFSKLQSFSWAIDPGQEILFLAWKG
jgi:hypothetical protein